MRQIALLLCAACLSVPVLAAEPTATAAAALIAKHSALSAALAKSPFGRPLQLESSDADGKVRGEVYAVVDQPYARVSAALDGPAHWCEIMILHINTKFCRATTTTTGTTLTINIGRKEDQPLADTYRAEFVYQIGLTAPDYFAVQLGAETGPLNTSNYRIELEVVALGSQRSFLHMTYGYSYGLAGQLATRGYLATVGRNKAGFTIVGALPDGKPRYIGGSRGVIERNTMRYYLAIDAYLDAVSAAPKDRLERRLQDWFDAVERYPIQLHELDRETYLTLKRKQAAASGIE